MSNSRLIVKNLPVKFTEDKLRSHFAEKGHITDCQLKFTKDGRFRQFAFVGFQKPESAKAAVDYFNNTFLNSKKITVEFCNALGDEKKPRAWSKYAPDSSAFQKLNEAKLKKNKLAAEEKADKKDKNKNESAAEKDADKKDKKKKREKEIDPEVKEKLEKYKDDPMFAEFLEVHGKDKSVWKNDFPLIKKDGTNDDDEAEASNDDSDIDGEGDEDSDKELEKVASADISDKDYLKLKSSKNVEEAKELLSEAKKTKTKEQKYEKLFTLKLKNLPFKARKRDVKMFMKPFKVNSIRVPQKIRGIAYVAFKNEEIYQKALNAKNKSFLNGKQILVQEYKQPEPEKQNDEEGGKKNYNTQEESLENEKEIAETGQMFVRNLAYSATEDNLTDLFSPYGDLSKVELQIDRLTRESKGNAKIHFVFPEHAVKAYLKLDGTSYQGRMLHILPDRERKSERKENGDNVGSYKKEKAGKLKKEASSSHNWNTLFLGSNTVAEVIADTYNASKDDILMGDGAAVRLALGETQLVSETKRFLEENGVDLDAFKKEGGKRSNTVILVKNLPPKTTVAELRSEFGKYGPLSRVLLPLSGVTAIVEFETSVEARHAISNLAYRKFKNTLYYLEWAPKSTFKTPAKPPEPNDQEGGVENDSGDNKSKAKVKNAEEEKVRKDEIEEEPEEETTLYIKNLNFSTDEDAIREHFKKCGKIANVYVIRKGELSRGYGFIQFYRQSSVNEALKNLQLSSLEGHQIELSRSNRNLKTETQDSKPVSQTSQTGNTIIVKNIPFQAKKSEITELFKTFGEIKSVRLPKKMDGDEPSKQRGFGFVEYYSKHDAKRAMDSFCHSTHFFGRRLVLEWAKNSENVEEKRKRTAQQFGSNSAPQQKRFKKSVSYMDPQHKDKDGDSDKEMDLMY